MKIFISGDFAPRQRVNDLIENSNYQTVFNDILPIIQQSDFAITNLESPLIEDGIPIEKTGPNLKSPLKSIEALKFAGFNMVTLANNHLMDYGKEGLISTMKTCESYNIQTIGAGLNLKEASQVKYVKIEDKKVSFINCCENEWSTTHGDEPGCNPIDEVGLFYQIQDAKRNSDYIILIIHGGHETYEYPSPRMKKLYRWFIDLGVYAVIGHHTHCFSGYEIYKGKPIVYSLGNFVFDSLDRNSSWNIGAVSILTIDDSEISLELVPFRQCDSKAGVYLFNENERNKWIAQADEKTSIINNDEILSDLFNKFAGNHRNGLLSIFEPFNNKYIKAAIRKGMFPSFFSALKKRLLLNLIRCEAHRDVLINILKAKNK